MDKPLKLHQYQQNAIRFAIRNPASFMMIDIGLGKTAIALHTIEKMGIPALVIAPLRVCYSTWPAEIKKWNLNLSYTILHGRNKNKNLALKKDVYILNYEGLKWFFNACCQHKFKMRKMFMIWDESSFVKSPSTQRFKTFKRMVPMFSRYRMCLSATPSPNGLHELWSQYFLLDHGKRLESSFYTFRSRYFSYTGPPVYKTTIYPGASELIHEKIEDITYRLDAHDYLRMPPITYNAIRVELTAKLRKEYDSLERDFLLEFDHDISSATSAAGLSMKLRQFIQGGLYTDGGNGRYMPIHKLKLNALKEMMEANPGQPILCPIQFRFELDMIQKEFKQKLPIIAGGVNAKTSSQYVDRWNAGKLPLLLCHPQSIGHGMNMQTGGHIVLWFGLTWSLEQYQQLNGRLHRQGQKRGVVINHIIMEDTIDVLLLKVLSQKESTQADLLNALKKYTQARL